MNSSKTKQTELPAAIKYGTPDNAIGPSGTRKGEDKTMNEILKHGSAEMGFPLTDEQINKLERYADMLIERNEKVNLTAICDREGIAVKHFLDSLSALCTGYVKGKVIDVGTGAGFPGLVLKIAKPEISLTLLDSLNKRIDFLKDVSSELETEGVDFVHARAEDGARGALRGEFDTVVSRAVANLTALAELCIPYLKVGGSFLALKGPLAEEELESAKRAIHILGGKTEKVFEVKIPYSDLSHKIIIIKKVRQTPLQYPRKASIPTKNPLNNCYNLKKGVKK